MPDFTFETQAKDGYVELICRGPTGLGELKGLVDWILKDAPAGGIEKKYLVDLRYITGTLDTIERFELGKYIAEWIPHIFFAAVSRKEHHNKVGENTAVNRGAHLLATDDFGQAVEWILSSGPLGG
jgi:hypothetical protein